jgi:hypothetical protein
MRRVVMISDPSPPVLRGLGKVLKLECGHSQWEAGCTLELTFGAKRPCIGGCYQFQKPMGRACNLPY